MKYQQTRVVTGNPVFDEFYPKNKSIVLKGRKIFPAKGDGIVAYTPSDGQSSAWIGNYPQRMKGFKYWEKNLKSFVDYLFEKQLDNGEFFDAIRHIKQKGEVTCRKVDNEASFAEYTMVEMSYRIWQATGDDKWMESHLGQLEKAINYVSSNSRRWSKEHQLIKRPFTIDTWDFEYLEDGVSKHSKFNDFLRPVKDGYIVLLIDKRTKFCIMHGDNSGVYQACRLLAKMYAYQGDKKKKEYWNEKAEEIISAVNKVCWNGKFYTHQVHIDPVKIAGVDESKQLSMSNTFDINRGITSHEQAVSIIREYLHRKETVDSFAEWFSIDPPFPTGTYAGTWAEKAGEYVNGGVMPLVGGELARACFEHGFEEYALDILLRYERMIRESGECYTWYYRDGRPGRSSEDTVGANTVSMLGAFIEGLAGVEDEFKLFKKVKLSPRWPVTEEKDVKVRVEYGASEAFFEYTYHIDRKKKIILITPQGNYEEITYHILLPKGTQTEEVQEAGRQVKFTNQMIEESPYVDFKSSSVAQKVKVRWNTKRK